jgi:photosystem II stability/assembly factor-like uncharacterized protein/PKD repeat protein
MNSFKTLFVIAALIMTCEAAKSQAIDTANTPIWIGMMDDPNANFFETQKAFNTYWNGRERHKGDGWKVFKRWEWYWADRVNQDGSFPAPDAIKSAYQSWEIAYNQTLQGAESIGGDWTEIGPLAKPDNGTGQPNGNGRLNAIAFHPTDTNTFWVGAPAGGLWKTTDGGSTWTSNTDLLPTLGVSAILIDPTNTNIMYIGTGDRDAGDAVGLGVYKSTDGGATWFQSNSGMGNKEVGAMIMHPNNSAYILAATSGGIYRSINSGSTWTLESSNSSFYKDIKWKPGSSTVAYATETSGSAGFYKTTDGGNTWAEITNGLPSNGQRYVIGVSANDPSAVYVLSCISSAYQGLYKSTDSGSSFNTQSTTPNLLGYAENGSGTEGQGWYDLCIEVDPTDASIVYVGGVNIWKSTDNGANWDCAAHWVGSSTAASVHADQHWLAYNPLNNKLFVCNDGGLYATNDGGNTWPELSSGLGIAQIYRIGVSQNTNALVINGYQDNGTAVWDNTLFRTERGGDGMECIIDPNNDQIMYATVYYGNITRSTNAGVGFGGFAANGTNGITEDGAWITPFILDRVNSDIMFIGYKNIWRTTNATAGTPVFEQISNNLAGSNSSNMRRVKQSKLNSNRIFAVRSDNKLFRSDNALGTAPTWTDLTTNLPGSGTLADIETSPFSNNTLWIIRGNNVYKSINSGGSWSFYSSGLPSINLNCLVADPLSNSGLYIGTDAGVYYIDNSLSSWIPFDDGLPTTVEITELEIYHPQGNWGTSRLRAGTYGRGLWESDLYDPENIAPLAFIDVSLSNSEVCNYDTISLWNNTAYQPLSSSWTITPSANVSFVGGTSSTSTNPKVVIAAAGSYSVKLVVSNAFGSDSTTLFNAITINGGQALPFLDDFEGDTPCSTSDCNLSCNVLNWNNLTNGIEDDIDFRVNFGTTPSGSTGPTTDYNPGTATGQYLYTEASFCFEQQAVLESPCLVIDQVTNPKISLAYHMYAQTASQMGDLAIDVKSNGVWTNLTTITGNQGNAWLTTTQNLNSYIGETVKFRLVANTGNQFQSDIAIDALNIFASPYTDFEASNTQACINEIITLSDSSSQNPSSWSWTILPNTFSYVSGSNSSSQNPQISFNAAGTYSVTLQTSNAYGADFEVKTNYISVSNPTPTISINGSSNVVCSNDSLVFTTPNLYDTYTFKVNGNTMQSGIDTIFSLTNFSNGDAILIEATDTNGCNGIGNTIVLTVNQAPEIILTCSDEDLEVCFSDTVIFTATASNVLNYNFIQNGLSVQDSAISTFKTNAIALNDVFTVSSTASNGCIGNSNTLNLNVLPLPWTPSIALILDSLNCSTSGLIYEWQVDSTISSSTSDMFAKQGDGTYTVRVFDNGCWSLWSDPFIITGIDDIFSFKFKLFPSPATDIIYLEALENKGENTAEIKIIDLHGKLVKSSTINDLSTHSNHAISIENLASGVYLMIVKIGNENIAIQFVKENR